jgi:pimeloyl-ACP methyl ester carboxylesterase
MATFALVPGAWLGGWVWQDVARDLRRGGHVVYPVTLTGLADRVHLARPEVDLETHITDVINLIEYEALNEVSLLCHSYSGIVITGVADRIPERLAQVIYLDSAPFVDGQSMLDVFPPEAQERVRQEVETEGRGWLLPVQSWEELGDESTREGLGDRERALFESRATPQPFRTYEQPLRLTRDRPGDYQLIAIACNDMRSMLAAGVPGIAEMTKPPWRYEELPTGHWPMLSMPKELAEMLDRISSDR